jgi:hypothetical protein
MEQPKVTEIRASERMDFVAEWGCGSAPKKGIRVPRPHTCGTGIALGKLRGDNPVGRDIVIAGAMGIEAGEVLLGVDVDEVVAIDRVEDPDAIAGKVQRMKQGRRRCKP